MHPNAIALEQTKSCPGAPCRLMLLLTLLSLKSNHSLLPSLADTPHNNTLQILTVREK